MRHNLMVGAVTLALMSPLLYVAWLLFDVVVGGWGIYR